MALHPDAVAQERSSAEGAGGVYPDDTHLQTLLAEQLGKLVYNGALSRPGWTGDPDGIGLPSVGVDGLHYVGRLGVAAL